MEFRQLRSFVEVVRQGSFTQAAQVRHASQSTISKQVAQLEQSLGVQVLERNGPHVRLTDAGAVVFRRAEEMLRLRRDLLSELDDLSQLNRGELRLGLPLLGADALFAQRFAEYRRRYPNIAVHLVEGGSKTMEQAVLAGELELAGSLTPADDGFDYQPFCNEPLDVLLPAGHPKAAAASVALGELADSPFLLYQQSFTLNDRLLRACLEAGFSPREGGRSGQADFLGALVAANQGVVLLPRVIAREIERPGVVRVLLREPDLRWDIAFIWRRGGYLSRAAQAWLELGVGRITASSAEATADNAWGRYSPYRLLPPRAGRITASAGYARDQPLRAAANSASQGSASVSGVTVSLASRRSIGSTSRTPSSPNSSRTCSPPPQNVSP